jgi:hypothetical protein
LTLSMMIVVFDIVFRRQCDIVFRHDSVILFSDTTVVFFVFYFIPKYIWTNKEKYPFYVTFILFDKEQLYSSTLKKIYIESYLFDACRSRSLLISLERERVKQLFYIYYMYMY